MTNEELVNNIVCKNCRTSASTTNSCNVFNKEYCFIYNSALQIANEKDKQFKLKENEINITKCGTYTTRTRS